MTRRSFLCALVAICLALPSLAPAADKLHIGVSIPAATHGWPAGVAYWAEQSMKDYPDVTWEYQRAANAAEQAGQIDAMVEKGIAALVVLPFDSDTPLPAIKKAKKQGVYIVSIDRGLREPVADLYLAGDNAAFGRKSAQYMVEKLKADAGEKPTNVVILRGMPVEIDRERYDAAMKVFNANKDVVKILDAQPGNWNRQDAHRRMQDFLTKYDDIDAVWASDDDMALGVEQAIKEAGRQGRMWIMGGAGMKDIIKRVMDKDPLYPADITYPPGMIAAGVHLAVANLGDGNEQAIADKIPGHLKIDKDKLLKEPAADDRQRSLTIDVQLVTPENAKEFYFPESVY
jgi:ribose transport system substrate-binding protein